MLPLQEPRRKQEKRIQAPRDGTNLRVTQMVLVIPNSHKTNPKVMNLRSTLSPNCA